MANAASTIEIELEIRQAIGRLNNLQKELNQTTQNFNKAADSTRKFEVAIGKAKTAAVAFFSVVTAKKIAEFSDVFTQFENRVKLATNSLNQQIAVQGELIKVAQQTATPLADIGELYSRMRLAAEQLGASQRDLINLTKTVGLTLKTQGTSAAEASGALLQLGQALNSPIVQAEEFNSLQDALPALLKEVTKNLGLQQGQLKKYVNDQKLSNKDLFDAILASQKSLEQQSNLAANTFESFGTRVENTITTSIGAFSRFMGATLTKRFKNFKDELYDTFPALDTFTSKLDKAFTIGPGTLDKFTRFFVLGEQPPQEGGGSANLDERITAPAVQQTNYQSAFFKKTIQDLEVFLSDIEKYRPAVEAELDKLLINTSKILNEVGEDNLVYLTNYGSDQGIPLQQYITELSKIVEIIQTAVKSQEEYNRLKIKDAQITEEGAALEEKILEAKFKINQAQEELNRLQNVSIYDGILNALKRFLGIQEDITAETEKQLSNAEKQAKAREQYVNAVGDTVVDGVFGAGENATRAGQAAQAYGAAGGGIPGLINAAASAALSNEKVAAAIEEYFTLLFETLDPFIDVLGDLISAINRLIGALIQNATNAAEGLLDTVGLGPNGYIFGGGLARDLEDAFGFGPGSSKATGPTAMQKAFAEADKVFLAIEQEQSTLEKLQPKIDELAALLDSLSLSDIIERFTEQTQKAIEPLQAEIEKYEFALTQTGPGGGANYFADFYNQQIQTATDKIAEVNEKTSIVISGLISEFLSEPLATLDDLERSATDSIAAIEFQNLSAEEQIQFRYDEAIATIEQQKALADLVNDEELRTQLLDSVNRATQAQNDLLAKQQEELQKLNEEREREAELLLQQQGQAQVDKLLSDLERTFDDIIDLVVGLREQASGLLLGQYSTLTNTQRFEEATSQYQDLLAAALDPDATEENVKDFQDFVDTYLKSAQDVFKSSSRYQNIFDSVLTDIEQVAEFVQATMPQSEIDKVREQLTDVAEEFGLGVEEVINGLDRLVLALTFRALVVDVPVQTVIDEGNSDLIVEAVITAVEDQQLSDTEIISIVTAVADKLSDTQIEEIVTAVAASGSDTNIEAVVSATASNVPIIQALVDAIAANIPTVTVDVEFNLDPINLAIAELGATLQGAVNNFIVDVNQASGAIEGETLSTLAAFGQGGDVLTSGLSTAIKGETTLSTEYVYSPSLGQRIYADTTLSADNREINAESLAASYVDRGIREPAYFIAYQFKDYLGYIDSYLNGFDYKADASNFYQRILELNNSLQTGQFQNIQKIGFRRGGLVDPLDTIPAMLSPGEYILSPETVRRYGVSNLNRLNAGDTAALNATSDPEVKRLLAELIVAVKENDTEVNVYTDMQGQTKASIEEFRSELRERTRRQGDKFLPARYI